MCPRQAVKAITDQRLSELTTKIERAKVSIRVAVAYPFRVIKRQFGHMKARYRGLAKNGAQVLKKLMLSVMEPANRVSSCSTAPSSSR